MSNIKIELMNSKSLPILFYGTAWKEERTAEYTLQALNAGFRAIDTANQRKHYFEEAVGDAITQFLNSTVPPFPTASSTNHSSPSAALARSFPSSASNPTSSNTHTPSASNPTSSSTPSSSAQKLTREDLFLQTKFTFANGQDHRKPYNEKDSFTQQVKDSFASSLKHLNTTYLDSYILHGPYSNQGIIDIDFETWAAMEQLHHDKKVRYLGISNVSAYQLVHLCQKVKIKPQFVQNRCFARMSWDKEVRTICKDQGIHYQGFSLLTANARELSSDFFASLSAKYKKTIPQIVFRFSQQLGMIGLTGSTKLAHLTQDLNIDDFELTPTELSQIESISFI